VRPVDVSHAKGVQVGDGNIQNNYYYESQVEAGGADSGRRPADSTWAVAVYGGERSGVLGAGVVIDAYRVLTCARVCAGLINGNGNPLGPLLVRFSKASPPVPGTESRRVIGVQLPGGEHDLAVLLLEEAVPAGVRAARLRRPVPEDLAGLAWWAFGFPEGQRLGDEAHGTVGAVLGEGFVRLGARSRCQAETGFSGSGLWSPEYEAVVGVIGAALTGDGDTGDDRTGGALALSLFRADRCFGAEGLAGIGGWSAEQAGEVAMSSWGWVLRDDPEYGPHWRPRSRGFDDRTEGGYWFRGRRAALTAITGWLGRDRTDRRALVVTGSPGVGKSAVLGRVVTTADPGIRTELPAGDDSVRAVEGSVACAVHAKGKLALDVAREIALAASAKLPGRLLDLAPAVRAALPVQGIERFNVIIDALDEAADGETRLIIDQVALPLLRQCSGLGVQVVIGTRRQDDAGSLISAFGSAVVPIDLDADEYFELEDLEAYALATLQQSGIERPHSPYADEDVARPLAARIAQMSDKNFLAAYLTALMHGSFDEEPADIEELTYTIDIKNALRGFLGRFGEVDGIPLSATRLLTALAYAEAPGLPIELWIIAIEALYGVRPEEDKLDEFTRSAAANFLAVSGEDPDQVFRLFHQALNDTLLGDRARRAVKDQRALTRAFTDYGRQVGWGAAPPYLLRSLSHHAERAGMLDELLTDDEYLLHADLRRLTSQAVESAENATAEGRQRTRLLRLTPYAASAGPQARRAMFSVTETLEKLGGSFRAGPGPAPYRARWSTVSTHAERVGQVGHTGAVTVVCPLILDGRTLLASGGEDEIVRIWDPATGRQQRALEGHAGQVNDLHAFPGENGRTLLASTGADALVRIWDPATGRQQRILEGHTGTVIAVCSFISGGRTLLASVGMDGKILLWDPASGELLKTLERRTGEQDEGNSVYASVCAFTAADGRTLLASGGGAALRVWDPESGQYHALSGTIGTGVGLVCAFAADDGRALLACATGWATVQICDPASGELQRSMEPHPDGLYSVCAFTAADGRTMLASSGCENTVRIWDPVSGEQRGALQGHSGLPWGLCAFTAADRRVLLAAAGDLEPVQVRDPATGEKQPDLVGAAGGAWSVCAFPAEDGHSLLASGGDELQIWDPATRQLQRALNGGGSRVYPVCAVTSHGRTLLASASASSDAGVRIWDPATGTLLRTVGQHTTYTWDMCMFASAGGQMFLAAIGIDDSLVQVWDPATGQQLPALAGAADDVWSVCGFTASDGRALLATAQGDATIRVWDPATGMLQRTIEGHATGVIIVRAFTRGGRTLLASGGEDAEYRIWDPATGQMLLTIPVHLTPSVVADVDGILVVGLSGGLLAIELNLENPSRP
jgi:WD40 repeat protein